RDRDKEPLLRELEQRYLPGPDSKAPVRHVLQTGEVLEIPVITDERIRATCVDDRHAEILRQLGTGSVVIVPLHVREVVVGAVMFTSGTPNRFGRADTELAVELGRRLALALDNTRLFEETRRALHLREEFLRIASHELRTPLSSIRLTVQA